MIANATAAGKDDTINNEDIGNANLYGVQKMTLRVCSYDYDSFDQRNTSYGEDGQVSNWTNVGENMSQNDRNTQKHHTLTFERLLKSLKCDSGPLSVRYSARRFILDQNINRLPADSMSQYK